MICVNFGPIANPKKSVRQLCAMRYRGFGLFDDHLLDSEAKARGAQHLSQLGGVNLDSH